jgi:hypothetical protein
VDYAAFLAGTDGGSAILSYELQMYNYTSTSWESLQGGPGLYTLMTTRTQEIGIEKGRTYMFRYRAWNVNGAGEFSSVSHLLAASVPSRPPAPIYGSSTTSGFLLLFNPSGDDGGQLITGMELEQSPLLATSWAVVSSYTGASMSHTLDGASPDPALAAHSKYRFRLRSFNAYGASPYSTELVLSLAPLPGVFAAVTKDQTYSSNTTIMLRWTVPATEVEPILGFRLRMIDSNLSTTVLYDAPTNPQVLQYLATGLTPGTSYSFAVLGYNFNGAGGTWSPDASFRACSAPSLVPLPSVTGQSSTQLSFAWEAPGYDGGCEVTGYQLLLDDKSSNAAGVLTQVYSGLAHVKQATITMTDPTTHIGTSFRFMLNAINEIGTTPSLVGYALFAAAPTAPTLGPATDASITQQDRIKVTWPAATSANNGGSEVTSYSLEMDDGMGGDFAILTGQEGTPFLTLTYTVYSGIRQGVTYRFRYRVQNSVGWSDYSPITFIAAAARPTAPAAPTLLAVSATGLTLGLSPSTSDSGSPITAYKIFRDNGAFTDATYANEMTNYDGSSTQFAATVLDDGLILGTTYRFVYVATNAFGDSDFSHHLIAGVGAPPSLAAGPTRSTAYDIFDQGTNTIRMTLAWSAPASSDLQVLGYQLLMDDGLNNDDRFQVMYDSGNNPLGKSHEVSGLAPSLTYRFQVKVRDINGLGPVSPTSSFVACKTPAELSAPTLVTVSQTSFDISWLAPNSSGGCPLTSYSLHLSEDQDTTSPSYAILQSGILATTLTDTTTFSDSTRTGKVLRVKVEAINQMGSVLSPALQFVLASLPAQPTPPPSVDAAGTTTSSIRVIFGASTPDWGGQSSGSYELEMDDGASGPFSPIFESAHQTYFSVT